MTGEPTATAGPAKYLPRREKRAGVALCLSGGGYRAMVFHVGVLWRLSGPLDLGIELVVIAALLAIALKTT